ncbi:MAG: hypothetical protein IKE43_05265 [Coriobacteriales bacterium]|nr:hypothetical protein [Coriobacteriales bacterium]
MVSIHSIIYILIYVLSASFPIVVFSGRSFGRCLPLVFLLPPLLLFTSGVIFNTFIIGNIAVILLCVTSIFISVKSLITNKNVKRILQLYFDSSFFLFLILFLLITVIDFNRQFTSWDEFSHWGIMVQEMLRLDTFYTVPESVLLIHKDYLPFASLIEYYICIFNGSMFSESICYFALHITIMSIMVYLFTHINYKYSTSILGVILEVVLSTGLILILCMLKSFASTYFLTIYADVLLSCLLALGLYCALCTDLLKPYNSIFFTIVQLSMVLTKQMGLAFSALCIGVVFLRYVLEWLQHKKAAKSNEPFIEKRHVVYLIMMCLLPLAYMMAWEFYTDNYLPDRYYFNSVLSYATRQFSVSDISVQGFAEILLGSAGEAWQLGVKSAYFEALYMQPIFEGTISLPFFQIIICICICFVALYVMYRKSNSIKRLIVVAIVALILGTIGYLFSLLALYLFCFGWYEGEKLASFERYMGSYVYGLIIFLVAFIVYVFRYQKYGIENPASDNSNYVAKNVLSQNLMFVVIIAVLILCQGGTGLKTLFVTPDYQWIYPKEQEAEFINSLSYEKDSIYCIYQDQDAFRATLVNYYLTPHRSNGWYASSFGVEADPVSFIITSEDFLLYLEGFDKLYLGSVDGYFIEQFGQYFDNPNDIAECSLYSVDYTDNGLKLHLIETMETD